MVLKCSRHNPIINLNKMKDLKSLTGAKILSREEQLVVKGGVHRFCPDEITCPEGKYCYLGICVPDSFTPED